MRRFHVRRLTSLVLASAVVGIAACDDDDPTGPILVDPAGLEVMAGATALVEVDGSTVNGDITVEEGAETDALSIAFLDDDGDPLTVGDSYHLVVDIADDEVATFEADEDDPFAGVFSGVAAGGTTVVLRLMHGDGDDEQEVYASPAIDIVVE